MNDRPLDPMLFRQAVGRFATGVTVITARHGELIHGMTANAVSSLSLDPLLMLICVDRRARMVEVLRDAGAFAINILSDAQESLSRHFSGRGAGHGPPESLRFEEGEGAPLIAGSLVSLTCRTAEVLQGGDHLIVTGLVTACRLGEEHSRPLLFFKGRYHHLKEHDVDSRPAPVSWNSESVSVYHDLWPDPLLRALAGDLELP